MLNEPHADLFAGYEHGDFWCEVFGSASPHGPNGPSIVNALRALEIETLRRRAGSAESALFNSGITFTLYSEGDFVDRVLPFDVIPRPISPGDWKTIETGVAQRVRAINEFLHDIYHDGLILKDGVVPRDLVEGNKNYRQFMRGIDLPHRNYVPICGIDIVRDADGTLRVLEDNARTPSGVSYVVENRYLTMRLFPDFVRNVGLRDVSDYGRQLRLALAALAPDVDDPNIVILTPGIYNSAYFEHVFLSREMGVPLVEGSDLVVEDDRVFMRTISGLDPVHVIYRRIDDDFIDPEVFRRDSMLGVSGLMRAYAKGNVALANGVGTGVADDKAVYAYMPRIIKYYLDQEPILQNVPTNICREKEGLAYTLDNIADLVTKPVGESGGYGVVIGSKASAAELSSLRYQVEQNPDNYISQPIVSLSVAPTLVDDGVEARHVDLRPFAVTGRDTWVLPGGLTRVALTRGSMVVNSSQGGGTKDTWVLV